MWYLCSAAQDNLSWDCCSPRIRLLVLHRGSVGWWMKWLETYLLLFTFLPHPPVSFCIAHLYESIPHLAHEHSEREGGEGLCQLHFRCLQIAMRPHSVASMMKLRTLSCEIMISANLTFVDLQI